MDQASDRGHICRNAHRCLAEGLGNSSMRRKHTSGGQVNWPLGDQWGKLTPAPKHRKRRKSTRTCIGCFKILESSLYACRFLMYIE